MHHAFTKALFLVAAVCLFSAMAIAGSVPVGILSYDVTGLNTFQFDITNQTGPNSSLFPDGTWPVTNTVSLSSLSLNVNLLGGGTETFGSSYFTLNSDGISFVGNPLSTFTFIASATLTGKFSTTTFNLNSGTSVTVSQSFSATLLPSSGPSLQDQDFVVIYGNTSTATTPEPESLTLMGTGLAALIAFRRKYLGVGLKKLITSKAGTATVVLGLCCAMLVLSASPVAMAGTAASVKLNTWTNPDTGAAGSSNTNLVGSGFPSGTISPSAVNISIATSCFGGSPATTTALKVTKILGSSDRIEFLIPASITKTGNYFVSIT